MTTHTIEIEGLPEGWKAVSVDATGCNFDSGLTSYPVHLKVEKIQPRRIVLEETDQNHQCNAKNTITGDGFLVHVWGEKIWKEVKE